MQRMLIHKKQTCSLRETGFKLRALAVGLMVAAMMAVPGWSFATTLTQGLVLPDYPVVPLARIPRLRSTAAQSPAGENRIIRFDTPLVTKESAVETVAPMPVKDGNRKVAGYPVHTIAGLRKAPHRGGP